VQHAGPRLRSIFLAVVSLVLSFATPNKVAAQDPCQQFFPPPPASCYAIVVTPQGSSTPTRAANTSGYSQVFTITLTGELGDTYSISCVGAGGVTCTGTSVGSVTLTDQTGDTAQVAATYSVGAAGTGTLTLSATGSQTSGSGYVSVPIQLHAVSVTPDGGSGGTRVPNTGDYTLTYVVHNTGSGSDTFGVACSSSSHVVCMAVGPVSVALAHGDSAAVTVGYSVSSVGSGSLTLRASNTFASDSGWYNLTVGQTAGAPIVDATPYNPTLQDYSRCAQACFAATYTQATVPYFSLDAPRSLRLSYNGDRVKPQPFVLVNVRPDPGYGSTPTQYQFSVKVNGAFVTFLNGEQTLHFAYADTSTRRIGGQFDASSYATGVYSMDLVVAAQYSGGTLISTDIPTKLVVENDTNSTVAKGWLVTGASGRLYTQSDGSSLVTDGTGSARYFWDVGGTFVSPPGDFSVLVASTLSGTSGWAEFFSDSTAIVFDNTGRTWGTRDRFGNVSRVTYDGSGRISTVQDPLGIPLRLAYGATGLASITDTGGRVATVTVDASRRLTIVKDPDSVTTKFGYDGSLRLDSITDRRGFLTIFGYDAQSGMLDSVKAPSILLYDGTNVAPLTQYTAWQKAGVPYAATSGTPATAPKLDSALAVVTEPGGGITRFTANRWGEPLRTTDPLGGVTTVLYDGNGLAIRVTHPSGAVDSTVYNASGLPTFTQSADWTNRRHFVYGGWGVADSAWGGPQPALHVFQGSHGVVDSVRSGESAMARYTYDSYGRTVTAIDQDGNLEKHWFAGRYGNTSKDSTSGGDVTQHFFDQLGRDSLVQPTNRATSRTHYDAMNRATKVYRGSDTIPVVTAYDSAGNITTVTDKKGQVYRFAYNALGWLTLRTDPTSRADSLRVDSLKYSRDGDLMRWVNRRRQTISYTYDAIHRATSKSGDNTDTDRWTYSTTGLVDSAIDPVSKEVDFQNVRGQPDSVKTILVDSTYWRRYYYDSLGQLDSLKVSGGGIAFGSPRTFAYDSKTHQVVTNGFGGSMRDVSYTSGLKPSSSTFTLGDTLGWQWDGHGELAEITSGASYSSVVTNMLTYDAAGRLTIKVDDSLTAGDEYYYDNLGRLRADSVINAPSPPPGCTPPQIIGDNGVNCLSGATWTVGPGQAFTYDSAGNRTDQGGTYGTGNRITGFAGCTYVTADSAGDVTSRTCNGQTATFKWTAESRLDTVIVGGETIGYRYDAAGRLIRKDVSGSPVSYFLWDGGDLVAELSSPTVESAEYSYPLDGPLDQPLWERIGGYTYDVHIDALGNVVAIATTKNTGQYHVRAYGYDAWGQDESPGDTLGLNGTDRARWKGALYIGTEAGLYYMRNRWYEPATGRFLSEDPLGIQNAGLNLYLYSANDPVNKYDPSGEVACFTNWEAVWEAEAALNVTLILDSNLCVIRIDGGANPTPQQTGARNEFYLEIQQFQRHIPVDVEWIRAIAASWGITNIPPPSEDAVDVGDQYEAACTVAVLELTMDASTLVGIGGAVYDVSKAGLSAATTSWVGRDYFALYQIRMQGMRDAAVKGIVESSGHAAGEALGKVVRGGKVSLNTFIPHPINHGHEALDKCFP